MKAFPLLLTTLALATLSGVTLAQGPEAPQGNGPENFARHKAAIQQALIARGNVLAQEQACVAAAARPADLKACHERAREAREQLGRELRGKLPGRGDGPGRGMGPRGHGEGPSPRSDARAHSGGQPLAQQGAAGL